jgi:hypothetical protein
MVWFTHWSYVFVIAGADDSLLNADGLTCYEGLNKEAVEQI